MKLNCDELNIAPNYINIEEINTKKILDDEREKLLNYIKSLKEEYVYSEKNIEFVYIIISIYFQYIKKYILLD